MLPEIPAVLESIIGLGLRICARIGGPEIQQSMGATLAKFERPVNAMLAERIAIVEKAVREQSVTVTALSRRAVESGANVQRLVVARERLCMGGTFDSSALHEHFVRGEDCAEGSGASGGKTKARRTGTTD